MLGFKKCLLCFFLCVCVNFCLLTTPASWPTILVLIQEFGFDSMERLYLVAGEDLEELTLALSSPPLVSSASSSSTSLSSTSRSVKMTRGEKRALLSDLAKERRAQDREDDQLSASAASLDLSSFRFVD